METAPVTLRALIGSAIRHRALISQLTKRDVVGRYRGSMIGLGWSFLNPLLMLAVFTFVFSVVFEAKWGVSLQGEQESTGFFAIVLFIGLIIHSFFSEILVRSPALIIQNSNYVKKVIFPLDILPLTAVLSALFHAAVSLAVWAMAYIALVGVPAFHVLYLPLVVLPLITLSLGISFFLASLGVYLRDIGQTMGVVSTALLFLSPVFFPIEQLPEAYRPFFLANPLTFVIQEARQVLVWKSAPDFMGLGVYMLLALGVLASGYFWFQKTRKGFADVL
ncbi:ABC transporter permease [Guyparkeria sp. SB14A]|uniref:ABC transporter permease n=1 Tax=Guyparkeria sp. SB14A TaxID=2571147 RepID=UPI0010AB5E55|nr:ABC transporter permease [Guyparkeria sp. SB14A]TKA89440.1 ABC transporter permease [Guyparkeria sp. SB14A]